ncbi:MAG TPA: anti-sigma factor [Tepidisphaeraceae bacterium]|jgi:anti-sigma-K factor RskA
MTCDQRTDLIFLHAAGLLDEDQESKEFRAHLSSGCPTCLGRLVEAEAFIAEAAKSLPPETPSPAAWQALESRLRDDRREDRSLVIRPQENRSTWRRWAGLAAAACVGAAVTGGALWSTMQSRNDLLQSRNDLLQSRNQLLGRPDVQLVSLGGGAPQPSAGGRIFWDRQRQEWHVYVFDLKAPAPGKTYELWFITPDEKKIPAGTFDVDANGRAELIVKVPQSLDAIALAAVTDEPIGGLPQPSGDVQLVGTITELQQRVAPQTQ